MINETVVMWTRQVPEVWEELERMGRYQVKKQYIQIKNGAMSDYYLELYEWYTNEARKHMDIPCEFKYPIWLSMDEDVRLQPVENTVILKVEIPADKYIICNMENWGYRVNYWYVPLNEQDEKSHMQELKKYGIASDDELILTSKGNFYPMLQRKLKESWARVFTMPTTNEQEHTATTWELRREWVKQVLFYDK